MHLTWRDNALAETGYLIERKVAPNDDFSVISQVAADSQEFFDSGLIDDQQYIYRIRATNGTSFSDYSAEAGDTTLELFKTIPNAPTNIRARADTNAIRIWWDDQSSDESNFQVERATALDGPYTVLARVDPDTTTYLDFPLPEGTVYYYRVRAIKDNGEIRSEPTDIRKIRTLVSVKTVIYATDPTGSESGDPLMFTIFRRNGTAGNIVVNYQVSGSATSGSDLASLTGSVTILNGQDSAQISIVPINDNAIEGDETVTITMLKGHGYKPSPNIISATATILDNDVVASASGSSGMPMVNRFSTKTLLGGDDETSLVGLVLG
jgi:fibronectin type 3 domain-containing protein